MSNEIPELFPIRIIAEYQLFGDVTDGVTWMGSILSTAKKNNQITNYKVLNSSTGLYGLRLIQFYADVFMPELSHDTAKIVADALLADILNDEVEVRWLESLLPVAYSGV